MKTRLILLLLVLAAAGAQAQQPKEEQVKILFLGNSFIQYNDLPFVLSTVPGSTRIIAMGYAPGGYTLMDHWMDPQSRSYLESGYWDYVVLQEQSRRPLEDFETMGAAASKLVKEVKSHGAQAVLFMTWPRWDRPEDGAPIAKAYYKTGKQCRASVAPVGEAWDVVGRERPDLRLYKPDGLHPSRLGTYLAACVITQMLQLEYPRPLEEVDPDDTRYIQRVAADAAKANPQRLR